MPLLKCIILSAVLFLVTSAFLISEAVAQECAGNLEGYSSIFGESFDQCDQPATCDSDTIVLGTARKVLGRDVARNLSGSCLSGMNRLYSIYSQEYRHMNEDPSDDPVVQSAQSQCVREVKIMADILMHIARETASECYPETRQDCEARLARAEEEWRDVNNVVGAGAGGWGAG